MLTFKLAKRTDIWLHTKIFLDLMLSFIQVNPMKRHCEKSATLAAYFSKARESSSVPVDYTEIRQVKTKWCQTWFRHLF